MSILSILVMTKMDQTFERSFRWSDKGRRQKKTVKKRSGWPLGLTPPPLPRSGQVNVKISRQVAIFGVILPFYIGQKWVKIFINRSSQAGGGVTPRPPKAVSLTAFSQFFVVEYFPYLTIKSDTFTILAMFWIIKTTKTSSSPMVVEAKLRSIRKLFNVLLKNPLCRPTPLNCFQLYFI